MTSADTLDSEIIEDYNVFVHDSVPTRAYYHMYSTYMHIHMYVNDIIMCVQYSVYTNGQVL